MDDDKHPLPDGWVRRWDPKYQRVYYVDTITKYTTWEFPRDPPPPYSPARTPSDSYAKERSSTSSARLPATGQPAPLTQSEPPIQRMTPTPPVPPIQRMTPTSPVPLIQRMTPTPPVPPTQMAPPTPPVPPTQMVPQTHPVLSRHPTMVVPQHTTMMNPSTKSASPTPFLHNAAVTPPPRKYPQSVQANPMYANPMHANPIHANPMHASPMHANPMHTNPMHKVPPQATMGVAMNTQLHQGSAMVSRQQTILRPQTLVQRPQTVVLTNSSHPQNVNVMATLPQQHVVIQPQYTTVQQQQSGTRVVYVVNSNQSVIPAQNVVRTQQVQYVMQANPGVSPAGQPTIVYQQNPQTVRQNTGNSQQNKFLQNVIKQALMPNNQDDAGAQADSGDGDEASSGFFGSLSDTVSSSLGDAFGSSLGDNFGGSLSESFSFGSE